LRFKIALVGGPLIESTARFWSHPRLAELYPESLIVTHAVVRASVPLMETALREARRLRGDPVSSALEDYLERHISEERGHDDWVLEDFEALGYSRQTALERVPSATAASLVGAQYYWILHLHPVSLLGYIAVLEGSPPDEGQLMKVVERTKLPAAAFSTLIRHARLDPYHRDELDRVIDALPLTQRQIDAIGTNAARTVALLARLTDELVARAVERTRHE
jgi:hypothetical protein